jgi:hypothetical protein
MLQFCSINSQHEDCFFEYICFGTAVGHLYFKLYDFQVTLKRITPPRPSQKNPLEIPHCVPIIINKELLEPPTIPRVDSKKDKSAGGTPLHHIGLTGFAQFSSYVYFPSRQFFSIFLNKHLMLYNSRDLIFYLTIVGEKKWKKKISMENFVCVF